MAGLVVKGPTAELLYTFDWNDVYGSPVTLDSVAYTVPTGLTQVNTALDAGNGLSSILLAGGTHGVDYTVVARATLSNGEKPDAALTLRCFNI